MQGPYSSVAAACTDSGGPGFPARVADGLAHGLCRVGPPEQQCQGRQHGQSDKRYPHLPRQITDKESQNDGCDEPHAGDDILNTSQLHNASVARGQRSICSLLNSMDERANERRRRRRGEAQPHGSP